ncbi:MAG: FUSC family protein [Oscillospiraceae bacterium]|nr:FUSC family protein [Oscillospiraceae bacterium]
MLKNRVKVHIGLRTLKTAAAVILSMIVVDAYGATTSKLIFAMLGAMAAVQPTFKESLESCLTQIVGVLLGALAGIVLLALKLPSLVAAGIGIVAVITLYNTFRIRFSPSLACLIVVTLCTTEGVQPVTYALTRVWDTAIGLGVGMAINTLIFPYDNSRQIRTLVESLDTVLIRFLEEMFDGDDVLPDAETMTRVIDDMARQLNIFSNQRLLMRLRRQQEELEQFRRCEGMARELLARMEVLSRMGKPGRLNDENRRRLKAAGADIRDPRQLKNPQERDMVTNYHVRQILSLRVDLLEVLKTLKKGD